MARADLSDKWKNLTANVKDATAELRATAMDILGLNDQEERYAQKAFLFA